MWRHQLLLSVGLFLLTLGGTMMTVFLTVLLPPYMYISDHQDSSCTVTSSHIDGNISCDGEGDDLLHPCLQIYVTYPSQGGNVTSMLYHTYQTVVYQITYTGGQANVSNFLTFCVVVFNIRRIQTVDITLLLQFELHCMVVMTSCGI